MGRFVIQIFVPRMCGIALPLNRAALAAKSKDEKMSQLRCFFVYCNASFYQDIAAKAA